MKKFTTTLALAAVAAMTLAPAPAKAADDCKKAMEEAASKARDLRDSPSYGNAREFFEAKTKAETECSK